MTETKCETRNDCVSELIEKWRNLAAQLDTYAPPVATAWRLAVCDLETALRQWELEELSLDQAVSESGYPYSALQKKLANGELRNVGTKGRPRVRRADIPKKGRSPAEGPELAVEILGKRIA